MNTYHISAVHGNAVGDPISTAGLTLHDMETAVRQSSESMEDLYYRVSLKIFLLTPNAARSQVILQSESVSTHG